MKKRLYIWIQIIAAATLLGLVVSNVVENLPKAEKKAKYIFLFIGDGMGFSHVAATEYYLSYKNGKLGGERLLMSTFPYCGNVSTYSANKNVTCSAAAGTAIACGEKTNNGMIGMNADSISIFSVASELKNEGYKVGIVTTAPINHATPAAFYAHNISRRNAYEISREIPESGFEFFAGAGFLKHKGNNDDQMPIDDFLKESGYSISYGLEEFETRTDKTAKAILCQESNHNSSASNYSIDYNDMGISLREMLKAGMDLIGADDPFFFMCEGGMIDWSAHANSPMGVIQDIIGFNDAVCEAYEFYMEHPEETLIIVTADHETGGMSLGTNAKGMNWKPLEDAWESNRTIDMDQTKANRKLSKSCSIGWTSDNHTSAHVPILAIGVGAEKFSGSMDNTDIKSKILCK